MARAKEPLEIGVPNVRTLKAEYKQSELTYVSGKIRIDILGLDCARHDEEFKFSTLRQYKLITSTAWRNQRNAAFGGLGVVLNKKATETFEEVSTGNKRILTYHFGGNRATTVIVHYAPVKRLEQRCISAIYIIIRVGSDHRCPNCTNQPRPTNI